MSDARLDPITLAVHADAVALQHECVSIPIGNQTGQAVAFAVYQPEAIRFGALTHTCDLPDLKCRSQFLFPKSGVVQVGRPESQQAHRNTSVVKMAGAEESPSPIKNLHEVAVGRFSVDPLNRTGKYPGVKTQHGYFFAGF